MTKAREQAPAEIDIGAFAAIVDLREGDALTAQIPGSIRVDRTDYDRIASLIPAEDAPILLYCGIGEASRIAARELAQRGFTGAVSLLGGFRRWRSEGQPVTTIVPGRGGRYDRHIRLSGVGPEGHARVRAGRVLVIGAGGLGSPVIEYLAAAGVGTLGIVDGDRVDQGNLQRQILYGEGSVGMRKIDAARDRVSRLNSDVDVVPIASWLDPSNALEFLDGYQLAIDASDNFATRLAVNDAAAEIGIPFIHGAALQWEGMVAGFDPGPGPCYRCLFPDLPENEETCSDVGVLGPVTGVIGSLMAVEAMKHLIGSPDRLVDRLVTYDARSARFTTLRIDRSISCRIDHSSVRP